MVESNLINANAFIRVYRNEQWSTINSKKLKNSLVPINQSKLCCDYLDMRKPYNGLEEK